MLRWFESGFKPPSEFALGLEWEKELAGPDGHRAPFHGPHGVESVLKGMTKYGWSAVFEGKHVIAMVRDGASITIEPGGQIELSTAPRTGVADIERDVRGHLRELQQITADGPYRPLAIGYTPVQPVQDIPFVPKARYAIMGDYLKRTGTLAHGMMKGTTSVQVTVDVCSHEDAARKVPVALALSPLVLALYANSPLAAGSDTGWASWRGNVWLHTDPARTGFMAEAFQGGFNYERYLDWVLDTPMLVYKTPTGFLPAHGRPFRDFLTRGRDGVFPGIDDFALQVNTVFPEVRIGKWLEMRSADNVPLPLVPALAALWKGLLYDPQALADAEELVKAMPGEERGAVQKVAASDGLAGRYRKRRLRSWCALMLEIAAAGLSRQGPTGLSEVAYLAPLQELVEQGESPAIATWRAFEAGGDWIEALSYPPVDAVQPIDPSAA